MRLIELLSEAKATKTRLDPKCWKGKKIGNPKTKVKGGVRVNNCVPKESIAEGDVFFIEAGDTLIETTVVYESNDRIIIDLDDTALEIIKSASKVNEVSASKALGAAGKRALQAVGNVAKAPIGAALSGTAAVAAGLQADRKKGAEWLDRSNRASAKTVDVIKKAGKRAGQAATNLGRAVTKGLGEDGMEEALDLKTLRAAAGSAASNSSTSSTTTHPKKKAAGGNATSTSNKGDQDLNALRDLAKEKGMSEAKYHGKEVPLGKRLPGDVKKSKVYVRKPNGKIVKVNFGDKTMRIKKSNPKRRKSFRARHNCKNPGPRWKARYWSCRAW